MAAKRPTAAGTLAYVLASTGAFSRNISSVCNLLQESTNSINSFVHLDGSIAIKGSVISLYMRGQAQVVDKENISLSEERTIYLAMYRNISVVAHISFVKTTTTECILYYTVKSFKTNKVH